MLIAAFIVLGCAVLLGTALAVLHLRTQSGPPASWPAVPWPLAALHGLIGIGGLICLLLALAALAGGGLLATRLRNRRRPGTLIGVHAALAVSGFVVLAAYLLAG